jgi:putative ABC transport system ATP-binding protein
MSKPDLPIIVARDVEKSYRTGEVEVRALRGVDLDVAAGEFVAIVGPSGSGKSTLFHILGGLTAPSRGTVRIAGTDLAAISDSGRTELRKTTVGFVFQKYNLLPTLTARENVEIARDIAGRKGPMPPEIEQMIGLLGLGQRMDHKPRAMSGGEQQRVAIARAIVNHPAILLADEPTGNLDSENSTAVLGLLRELNHRFGQTILMITHNPEAAAYADRIVSMRDGRIVPAL